MEGFAYIEKTEQMSPFVLNNLNFKELVIKDSYSYPGYYSETPGENEKTIPDSLFVVLKNGTPRFDDQILRADSNIRKHVDYYFEINYSRITFLNIVTPCIRIRLKNSEHVPALIEELKNEGFVFEKHQDFKPYLSHIKVSKIIEFEDFTENVYKEKNFKNVYYVKVSKKIDWDSFVKIILSIRGTSQFKSFDAAHMSLYRKNGIQEFVRIYAKDFTIDDFEKFRVEFENKIKVY